MPTPQSSTAPSEAAEFSGSIHFRGNYAYFQNGDKTIWAMLQSDSPYSGNLDLTKAAQTAQQLSYQYKENFPIQVHGVLVSQPKDSDPTAVLFLF
jgi:hypothetical protein